MKRWTQASSHVVMFFNKSSSFLIWNGQTSCLFFKHFSWERMTSSTHPIPPYCNSMPTNPVVINPFISAWMTAIGCRWKCSRSFNDWRPFLLLFKHITRWKSCILQTFTCEFHLVWSFFTRILMMHLCSTALKPSVFNCDFYMIHNARSILTLNRRRVIISVVKKSTF